MGIVGGFMVPHPPLIIPEIGRGGESVIEETKRAYEKTAQLVAELEPDTLVISSPHSVLYYDYFHISPGAGARGDFSRFRAPEISFEVEYDEPFVKKLSEHAAFADIAAGVLGEREPELDHGTMVPLYFIRKGYEKRLGENALPKIVRIGLSGFSLKEHYRFGMLIQKTAKELGRRVVYIASGDLSHKLKTDGPYGLDPLGPVYDGKIMRVMGSGTFDQLLDFDEHLLNKASECGHRSFVMMAGALDRLEVEIQKLSYQEVTGVGYGICSYLVKEGKVTERRAFLEQWDQREKRRRQEIKRTEDAYVRLARKSLESYITSKRKICWDDVREEILRSEEQSVDKHLSQECAGTFVSLHKNGKLRGCIGTIMPTRDCIAEEIIENAVSASTRDPRFTPVTEEELSELEYSVDVLGQTEPVRSEEELDVKKYGVIVTKGRRRGLLLPNLDGVDTVEEQLRIAKEKAGLSPDEGGCRLERFEVVRHF